MSVTTNLYRKCAQCGKKISLEALDTEGYPFRANPGSIASNRRGKWLCSYGCARAYWVTHVTGHQLRTQARIDAELSGAFPSE